MPEINSVIKSGPAEDVARHDVTMAEIAETTRRFIERNMTLSPEQFATLFGKKVDWALARMRDGSVKVLDEHAKTSPEGTKFSKYARIDALSVEAYRSSLEVPI